MASSVSLVLICGVDADGIPRSPSASASAAPKAAYCCARRCAEAAIMANSVRVGRRRETAADAVAMRWQRTARSSQSTRRRREKTRRVQARRDRLGLDSIGAVSRSTSRYSTTMRT